MWLPKSRDDSRVPGFRLHFSFAVACRAQQAKEGHLVLVELESVEQRYKPVSEVLSERANDTDVARPRGSARPRTTRRAGMAFLGWRLADQMSAASCPHQDGP